VRRENRTAGFAAGNPTPLVLLLIVCWLVFPLQGCLTIVRKSHQAVHVTAMPKGARVLVDGTYRGEAPLSLKLAKKPPHVIRIEKDGYRPVEIRLRKRTPWVPIILSNLIWVPPIAVMGFNPGDETPEEQFAADFFPLLALGVYIGAVALDGWSSRSTEIEPRHLTIILENSPDGEPKVTELEAASFWGLYWISVRVDENQAFK
jgi:PEGA domain